MNKRLVLTFAISTAVLAACGKAELLVKPQVPDPTTEVISATISFGKDTAPESVHSRGHTIRSNSSIVINVPNEKMQRSGDDFQTNDLFSEAEQEIEKGLIERGFSVLSRDKFEAKLRQMRDEAGTTNHDQARNGKNELTDVAAVIRAAQDGETRADYILQINRFDTNKQLAVSSDLRKNQDIIEFMDKYPSLRDEMNHEENHQLECAVSGADFNAKLIDVTSGSIVWIGNFEANELNAGIENLTIRMGQRTTVTNERDVERFIRNQNTDDARKLRKKKPVQVPGWEYKTDLIPYTITAGTCNKSWKLNRQNASQLTRSVARDLIKTIKVHY